MLSITNLIASIRIEELIEYKHYPIQSRQSGKSMTQKKDTTEPKIERVAITRRSRTRFEKSNVKRQ